MVLVEAGKDVALDVAAGGGVVDGFRPQVGRIARAGARVGGLAADGGHIYPGEQLRLGGGDLLQGLPNAGPGHDALRATTTGREDVMCSASWPPSRTLRPPIWMSPTTNPSSSGTSYSRRTTAPGFPRTMRQ